MGNHLTNIIIIIIIVVVIIIIIVIIIVKNVCIMTFELYSAFSDISCGVVFGHIGIASEQDIVTVLPLFAFSCLRDSMTGLCSRTFTSDVLFIANEGVFCG